jgi:hypothetical protein
VSVLKLWMIPKQFSYGKRAIFRKVNHKPLAIA